MHVPRATLAIYFHKEIKLDSLIALSVIMVGIYMGPSVSGGEVCEEQAAGVLPSPVCRAGGSGSAGHPSQCISTGAPCGMGQRGHSPSHAQCGNLTARPGGTCGSCSKTLGTWKRGKFSQKNGLFSEKLPFKDTFARKNRGAL